MARYARQSPQGEETLYADGVAVSQIDKTRSGYIGRVPAFVGLAKANGGVYAENLHEGMPIDRALQAARLDYRVVTGSTWGRVQLAEPMITTEGVLSSLEIEDKRHRSVIGIWGDGNATVFGQPRKGYQVVQPAECAELGQTVLGLGHKLVAAGTYGVPLGASMYLAFHIGTITVGGQDRHDMYAHLLNSFHGHAGLHLAFAPIRFDCTNQTAMNFGRLSQRVTIRHTGNIASKIEALKESLAKTHTWASKFEQAADKLLRAPMNDNEFAAFADKVMATPKRVKSAAGEQIWASRRLQLVQVLHAEHNQFGAGTRYAGLNALTSVLDHDAWINPLHHSGGPRRATARWERAMDGGDETRLKIRAAELLLSGL